MLYLSSTLSPTFYTPRIGKDTSFIHAHVQNYTGRICIHKVHKDQVQCRAILNEITERVNTAVDIASGHITTKWRAHPSNNDQSVETAMSMERWIAQLD
jgi:hypothetical protein